MVIAYNTVVRDLSLYYLLPAGYITGHSDNSH